jgi:molecular chaperone GrpE
MKDVQNTYLKAEGRGGAPREVEVEIQDKPRSSDEAQTEEQASNHEVTSQETIKEMEKMISELASERDELKDKFVRTAAEMENLRRRTMKEKQEIIEYANERLLFKMLDILDDLGNAVEAARKSGDSESILKGIEMIQQKSEKLFLDAGVTRIPSPVGSEFDVHFHEALMHVPSEFPENNVINEVQPGYMIHNKVLRHTKVVTSAGEPANNQ